MEDGRKLWRMGEETETWSRDPSFIVVGHSWGAWYWVGVRESCRVHSHPINCRKNQGYCCCSQLFVAAKEGGRIQLGNLLNKRLKDGREQIGLFKNSSSFDQDLHSHQDLPSALTITLQNSSGDNLKRSWVCMRCKKLPAKQCLNFDSDKPPLK